MTVDDENSVYVGGLPYDITEEFLRRIFSEYGSIVTVKIVNDRNVKGKCYGFVTFSNRRSADSAIEAMDGQNIGGRPVRVNEVTTRGGRLNQGGGRFQQHNGGWDQSPDRRTDCNYERNWYSDRSRERDRSQDRRKDHYTEKERAYKHSHEFERRKDHKMLDRNGYKERFFEGDEGDWGSDRSFEDNGKGINGTSALEGEPQETKREDSAVPDGGSGRDNFSNSSGDQNIQVKEDLEALIKMREGLKDEGRVLKDKLRKKEVLCSELQEKSKRLEDLLINEKKLTSQHRRELEKLYKSFSRVKESKDKLKECEQELQSLVNSAAREDVVGGDEGLGNGYA